MKGLLHSKRFKKNLYKWLFMYVGVMGLLTTVVTYSKFITSFNDSDEARASKFGVTSKAVACDKINNDEFYVCETALPNQASTYCRPTTQIASCFEVDTTGLEVDSSLFLTFTHSNKYVIEGIDMISTINGRKESRTVYDKNNSDLETDNTSGTWKPIYSASNVNVTLQRRVTTDNSGKWTFRVRLKRKIDLNNKEDYNKGYNESLVTVGYVMEQVNSKGGN